MGKYTLRRPYRAHLIERHARIRCVGLNPLNYPLNFLGLPNAGRLLQNCRLDDVAMRQDKQTFYGLLQVAAPMIQVLSGLRGHDARQRATSKRLVGNLRHVHTQ